MMRQLFYALMLLVFTQNSYSTDKYPIIEEMRRINVELLAFDDKTPENKRALFISSLNCYREAKQESTFFESVRSMEPFPEYEGFDQEKKSFTLDTCLTFSNKTLPLKEISPEDMKPLIGFLMAKTAVFISKTQLLTRASVYQIPSNDYDETMKESLHELIFAVCKLHNECHTYNASFESAIMSGVLKSLKGEIVKCQIPRKIYKSNKRKEIKHACILTAELGLGCYDECLTESPNEPCNDKCSLKGFTQFSMDELFDFYKVKFIKYDQLLRASKASLHQDKTTHLRQPTKLKEITGGDSEIAPQEPPKRNHYSTGREYLAAKLAYEREHPTPKKALTIEQKETKEINQIDLSLFDEPEKKKNTSQNRNNKTKKGNQASTQQKRTPEPKIENNKQKKEEDPFIVLPDGKIGVKGISTPYIPVNNSTSASNKKPVTSQPTLKRVETSTSKAPVNQKNVESPQRTTRAPTNRTQTISSTKPEQRVIPTSSYVDPSKSYTNALQNKNTSRINSSAQPTTLDGTEAPKKDEVDSSQRISVTLQPKQQGRGNISILRKDDSVKPSQTVTITNNEKTEPKPVTETKQELPVTTEKPIESQEKTTVPLKQPTKAVYFPIETVDGTKEDVQKHLIQKYGEKVTVHTYTHDREEANATVEKLRAALEKEKREKEAREKELEDLKTKLAQFSVAEKK